MPWHHLGDENHKNFSQMLLSTYVLYNFLYSSDKKKTFFFHSSSHSRLYECIVGRCPQ